MGVEGVHGVFDGPGPATFEGSLALLRQSGNLSLVWPILGAQTTVPIVSRPKSIKLGCPVFFDHIHTPELLRARTFQLFTGCAKGDCVLLHPPALRCLM